MKKHEHRTVVEIEEKFSCSNNVENIKEEILSKGFKFIKNIREVDEYFTDLKGEYIKNRTCLRIRIIEDNELEITYKGKSEIFSSFYAKKESNIISEVKSYNNIVELFKVFGCHTYTVVDKTREYYCREEEDVSYNILIDSISNVGEFIEFEIILSGDCEDGEEYFSKFIEEFKGLNLEKADLPYRDFVAKYYYEKLELNRVHSIHIESKVENIVEDCSLINVAKEKGISFSSNIEQTGFLEQKQEGSLVVNKYQDYYRSKWAKT